MRDTAVRGDPEDMYLYGSALLNGCYALFSFGAEKWDDSDSVPDIDNGFNDGYRDSLGGK